MVIKKYNKTKTCQRGGSRPARTGSTKSTGSKPKYSHAEATAYTAGTIASSVFARPFQGVAGTLGYSGRLGYQYAKRSAAKSAVKKAGLFNVEKIKKRIENKQQRIKEFQQKQTQLRASLDPTKKASRLDRFRKWYASKQVRSATSDLESYIDKKTKKYSNLTAGQKREGNGTVNTAIERAKRLLASGEGSIDAAYKKRQEAYNAKQKEKRNAKTKPMENMSAAIKRTLNVKQRSLNNLTGRKTQSDGNLLKAQQTLQTLKTLPEEQRLLLAKGQNIKVNINGVETTLNKEGVLQTAQEARKNIIQHQKDIQYLTSEINKTQKGISHFQGKQQQLSEAIAKAQKSVPTANQLQGSLQRRKQRVSQTKNNLGLSLKRLSGYETLKDIAITRKTYDAYVRGEKTESDVSKSMFQPFRSFTKSLEDKGSAISARTKPTREAVSMALTPTLASKTEMKEKIEKLVGDDGALKTEAEAIKTAFANLKPGAVVGPELKERHSRLMKRIGTATSFVENAGIQARRIPEPVKPFLKLESLAKRLREFKLPDMTDQKAVKAFEAQIASEIESARRDYKGKSIFQPGEKLQYYNFFKYLKNLQEHLPVRSLGSSSGLVSSLQNLLPPELQTLPYKKPSSTEQTTASTTP